MTESEIQTIPAFPEWKRNRIREGMRSSHAIIGRSEKTVKFMISVAISVFDEVQKEADTKGLSVQEQVRVILGDWKQTRSHTNTRNK